MTTNEDVKSFGNHVVCLIDVLGQKQKLAAWATMPADGVATPAFIHGVNQTAGTVLEFRDRFRAIFDELEKCAIPEKIARLPKDGQEKFKRVSECKILVERFSDTFVFSSQLANAHGDASTSPLHSMLVACCQAMIASLAAKVPVRGAITLGMGGVLTDGSFYGPALAEAHAIESEIAGHPRVVVSPTVLEFLDADVFSSDQVVRLGMKAVADICRRMICPDIDGCLIVDFIGEQVHKTVPALAEPVRMAYEFVRNESERYRVARDSKLATRYFLLREYLKSRLGLWSLKE